MLRAVLTARGINTQKRFNSKYSDPLNELSSPSITGCTETASTEKTMQNVRRRQHASRYWQPSDLLIVVLACS
ncbi:hypothetical protein QCA50_020470 [Cerrena zonata]|uniref:Uncharacterized protein n=1 Tax=Cerrena zonata TaxID=2478898 RepID=A0AAW0F8B7_9APHY